jgi:hypothetical protein
MVLEFPNRMCSIDDASGIIRFSGHDGMMEIRFSMALTTLNTLIGETAGSNGAHLSAFDSLRPRIQEVAVRAYGRSGKSFHILGAEQF